MSFYNLEHPEIEEAVNDLKHLLNPFKSNIEKVMLFGSTLKIPIEEAKDIDFFIAYKNADFDDLRSKLLENKTNRRIAIENHEAKYSNCPIWDDIILYREGKSEFSPKLLRTKEKAVDITKRIFH